LIAISFLVDNYWSPASSAESVKEVIEEDIHNQQRRLEDFLSDTTLIKRLSEGKYDKKILEQVVSDMPFVFINRQDSFTAERALFWNTHLVQPPARFASLPDGHYFDQLANGWYVIRLKTLPLDTASHYRVVGLIPVKWEYYTENKYLQNTFVTLEEAGGKYDISRDTGSTVVKDVDGRTLFYLYKIRDTARSSSNHLAIWLRIIACLLVMLYIHICATYFVYKKGVIRGSIFLVSTVLLLRIISYFLAIPFQFRQLEIFDPAIYGSNIILRSLGDLFINAILCAWIVLFIRYHLHGKPPKLKPQTNRQKYVTLGVISVVMVTATLMAGRIVQSLVTDSNISFDVVDFFTLNVYSFVGFIILCCIAAAYFFLFQVLLFLAGPSIKGQPWLLYLFLAVAGLLIITLWPWNNNVAFELMLIVWMLLFIFLLNYNYFTLLASRLISSKFIFWIFFFSVSMTTIIVSKNSEKELETRKNNAENIARKADPSGGVLMNILLTEFRPNFLTENFHRFHNPIDNKNLKDSLLNETFTAYLNKYDTRIYTFDAAGNPLYNSDETSLNTLNTVIETQGKATDVPGLYYYDVSYDKFAYISKREAKDWDGNFLGYVFILSNPKDERTDALYPQLFSRGNTNSIESSPVYAFAIYNKGKLSSSHNDYPFPTELPRKNLTNNQFLSVRAGGWDELWYKASADKVVVVAKPNRLFIESITLFAYLFCSFLLLTAVFYILNLFIRARFNFRKVQQLWHLSIRHQVHGTIIIISILSFVIIGVATILFFISRYHNNNREKLSRTINVMEKQVRNSLRTFSVFDDEMKIYDVASREQLEKMIHTVSEIHTVDINLYDLEGNLKVTSFPFPYDKGIISKKMDPMAFYHLSHLKQVQFFQEQEVGNLKYLSNYVPVRDESGKEYAYLNIPYFLSQRNLQDEISNFLVTIINLNAFIFLIAGIVALFITNRITQSFSLISGKMKEVNLGQVNEEIAWSRKDEIGDLVNEYNKMVKKLDASAELLARSEREGAWREMARQVAHEIKNPLTPMKLNLQYLQMAIDTNAPGVKEISVNVARTLLAQIEHLSKIASDFSQFANIGQRRTEVFNLIEVLEDVVRLFSSGDRTGLKLEFIDRDVLINADRTQINRLFTNLIQNAIQAVPDGSIPEIIINVTREESLALISVQDNGSGIPSSMKAKIFTPNFTTKTSGTGLGLAMCKGIVEQSQGNIWFETREGRGTTFFVELPLANRYGGRLV
jgi:two-component system, NtrC family, nitrogen regulation sensor histidine kinase NtrY